jgi:DNA sulfur modification protein DndE
MVFEPLTIKTMNGQTNSLNISSHKQTDSIDSIQEMKRIENSSDPKDIATLAYIWGYPLVQFKRLMNFETNPNSPPAQGNGPINKYVAFIALPVPGFASGEYSNPDLLYASAWLNLTKEPIILKIPEINNRYHVFQFIDAFNNDFHYLGTRTTGENGGLYAITGPDWKGQIPGTMQEIKSPTNSMLLLSRILVKGPRKLSNVTAIDNQPRDLSNVTAIENQISTVPMSVYEGKNIPQDKTIQNTSDKTVPMPALISDIPKMGIKVFDQISKDMIGNPLNPPNPQLVSKLELLSIGPGKTPSTEANETIRNALQAGITQGEKLIEARATKLGPVINGWEYSNPKTGLYGNDYLLNAATVLAINIAPNVPQEATYPETTVDGDGKQLNGRNNYIIHLDPGQTPPISKNGYWSITMYDEKDYLVENQLNRYSLNSARNETKFNEDGSLDLYIQHTNPGIEKEPNWLPAPSGNFSLLMRIYIPQDSAINGEYQIPPVRLLRN